MASISLRIDEQLKENLQQQAKNLGLSLNQLINLKLREFMQQKTLNLDLNFAEFEDLNQTEIDNLNQYANFDELTEKLKAVL